MTELLPASQIQRHKAAIRRGELSLAFKCLQRDRLLTPADTVFDYGCGHGEGIARLSTLGMECEGWDPAWRPKGRKPAAEVVNLGYVLNVIEDVDERAAALREAWSLCRRVLAVAARILVGGRGRDDIEYGDGILTKIGTFQKFFTQSELREYIETELQVEAVPAAPGVFFVFRDEGLRQQFLATRYRRRSATRRKRISELRFERQREWLEPLMDWVADRGRVPEPDEFNGAEPLIAEFGSLKRAFALARPAPRSMRLCQCGDSHENDLSFWWFGFDIFQFSLFLFEHQPLELFLAHRRGLRSHLAGDGVDLFRVAGLNRVLHRLPKLATCANTPGSREDADGQWSGYPCPTRGRGGDGGDSDERGECAEALRCFSAHHFTRPRHND